ncbi:hypothetical protein NH26_20335 [Flammeovirga pacifica]|uniref:DUF4738 domain-containing protein n=2 Tax=Flammeovirga pacifica TaxID=915059 RepID=A0A1S1YSF5_FLAPC|nr:hypothetical protein NH26_20335 [Flammeovirga pacifica]
MTILFLSCSEQKKGKVVTYSEIVKAQNERIDTLTIFESQNLSDKNIIERFFPEENENVKFDTIVSALNLKISIQSTTLDTYVTNEYEIEGVKHIDKYRDSEKHLIIEKSNKIVIDTVFKKSDFTELTGKDFLKIADFHRYWFNKIENDTIEFFGVVSKPETDWSVAFYHSLDLKSMTFELEEFVDEEI